MVRTLSAIALILGLVSPVCAQEKANQLFGAKRTASAHVPAAIGTYAKGCGAGLMQLPETGPTWQAMRLSRNRNWGHPEMIAFIQRLGAEATRHGWAGLYIGDISQPRGGPMTSGHASHQIGLDADIWMLPPKRLNLSRSDREKISSLNVRSADQRSVNGNFTRAHYNILKAAASDPAVDRIFVTPPVKIEMCKTARRADRAWLQKIRPLYGHNTHFHIRLKCPAGSAFCQTQRPSVAELSKGGDGCDETLQWWVTDYLNPPKTPASPPAPRKRGARDYTMEDLPGQCAQVLAAR
ncbi:MULTISPECIES: penicillin-insensitive murein endopeptidase [Actibacterium]|uniref:Penicillin-insensitive murein endopeptidase n=1 Tax=Actibacterium naphthalenivorans TaxID=1614693 RepID=A0A840CBK5_9RHOB|nr:MULTISPECIES: penicillin-insensitive murein endopeptidase [Actibacterium]ALG89005.1 peptidase [Actibacterium sp. EMB200-NS6]MBB4021442.1 penicillin-insensitive murein endopeptidase [Actibacterium naphthalenivorans]